MGDIREIIYVLGCHSLGFLLSRQIDLTNIKDFWSSWFNIEAYWVKYFLCLFILLFWYLFHNELLNRSELCICSVYAIGWMFYVPLLIISMGIINEKNHWNSNLFLGSSALIIWCSRYIFTSQILFELF